MDMIKNKEYELLMTTLSILKSRGTSNLVKVHYTEKDSTTVSVLTGTITGFSHKCIYLRQAEDKNSKLLLTRILKIIDMSNLRVYSTVLSTNIDPKLVGSVGELLAELASDITKYESAIRESLIGEYVELVLKDRAEYSELASLNNNEVVNKIVRNQKFIGNVLGLSIKDITPDKTGQPMSTKDVNIILVLEIKDKGKISTVVVNTAEFDVYKVDMPYVVLLD